MLMFGLKQYFFINFLLNSNIINTDQNLKFQNGKFLFDFAQSKLGSDHHLHREQVEKKTAIELRNTNEMSNRCAA